MVRAQWVTREKLRADGLGLEALALPATPNSPTRDDKYVKGVQGRNLSILEFDQTIASLNAALANHKTVGDLSQRSGIEAADSYSPGPAESAVQPSMTLTATREECLRLIYEASRALSLATFEHDFSSHSTLGLSAPTKITAAGAREAAVMLVTNRRQPHAPAVAPVRDRRHRRAVRASRRRELHDRAYRAGRRVPALSPSDT